MRMHFSTYPLENEMCNNGQQESPATSRAAMLDDATSHRISGSYVDHLPNMFDMNNQNQIMCSRYPVYSAVEGEPICDLLASAHISTHPVYAETGTYISGVTKSHDGVEDVTQAAYLLDGGNESQGQFVPATELAGLLASRGCAYDNVDDPAAFCGSINSRTLRYSDEPHTSFTRSYDNQMQGGMADVCAQPYSVTYGSSIDSQAAENGFYHDIAASYYPYVPAFFSNELSLSLATTAQGRGSEQSSSAKNSNECYLNYASCRASSQPSQTPTGSSYLWAVQQILADLATFSLENLNLGSYSSCSPGHVGSSSGAYSESEGIESSQACTLSLCLVDFAISLMKVTASA